MSYWKGLLVAAALDVALIVRSASVAPVAPVAPVTPAAPQPEVIATAQLADMDHLVDSLMVVVQGDSLNAGAMEELAHLYANHGWHEAAIGPLARALQLAPERRRLWVALDRAVAASGRGTITDAELIEAARRFAEAVDMWGHGC